MHILLFNYLFVSLSIYQSACLSFYIQSSVVYRLSSYCMIVSIVSCFLPVAMALNDYYNFLFLEHPNNLFVCAETWMKAQSML